MGPLTRVHLDDGSLGVTTAPLGSQSNPIAVANLPLGASITSSKTNSAATTNATIVKVGACSLFSLGVSNVNAAARFLKLYDKASAPTVGTDTPVLTIAIAASTTPPPFDFGVFGMRFTLGLAFAITGAAADSDTTVIAAGDVKVVANYA